MSHERKMVDIPCMVQRGGFSREVSVRIESLDGNEYSGFFDEKFVTTEEEINDGSEVEGRFSVEIIEEDEDSVYVELSRNPARHLMPNTDPRVWLPNSFLLPQEEVITT